MQKEINLLPRKNIGFFQREQTILIARVIAVFSVILVISSFVGLFFLQKNYSLVAIVTQQDSVKSRLDLLQGKINKQITLVDRAKKIETIMKMRPDLVGKLTFLQKQVPANVSIKTIAISEKDVTLFVDSNSLTSLQQLIDGLSTLVAKKKFLQKLTIDNIVINQQAGTYSVGVRGTFL